MDRFAKRKAPDVVPGRASPKRRALGRGSDATHHGQQRPAPRPSRHVDKRPATVEKYTSGPRHKSGLHERLFSGPYESLAYGCRLAPSRTSVTRLHSTLYHRPLLLLGETGQRGRCSLLRWYDSVSGERLMPWRKPFSDSREGLAVRAYEVWISEVMLQQTRVAVVKDYWTRWMKKWPTMEDLAAAHQDEVLGAWRGLGCM